MAYYDMIVMLLVALVLLNPVLTNGDQADQQFNSNQKKTNEGEKSTDWNDISDRISNGLKAFFKPYVDWFNGADACSKNSLFGIQTAISRGAVNYVSCVKEASNNSLFRRNQTSSRSTDTVQSKTTFSIVQFTTDCFSRILSLSVYNLVQGCAQDFIQNAMTFINESSSDVKEDMKAALNDSIKVAKCADDTMAEASKMASMSLTLFNFCRSKMNSFPSNSGSAQSSSSSQPVTQTTKPVTPATLVSSTQSPTTQPSQTTQPTTTQPSQTTQPTTTQPTTTQPTTAQTPTTQPTTAQTPTTQPTTTQPPTTQPTTAQTPTTQPTTTQIPTTQPSPQSPTTQSSKQTSTTQSTSSPTTTTSTPPTERPTESSAPKSNISIIIQSAVDKFHQFDDRIEQLRNLVNEALQRTQSNYGNIIDIDVISITDTVVNAGRSVRQRIDAVKARFKTNITVIACYNTSYEDMAKLVSQENTKTQSCFLKKSAIIASQVSSSINIESEFNAKQMDNVPERIRECANHGSQLSDELVAQCVEQILKEIDEYLTNATNDVQKLLEESKDQLDMAMKCVQDGFNTVKTVTLNILNNFKNCTGINA